jgi:hypothetical protein
VRDEVAGGATSLLMTIPSVGSKLDEIKLSDFKVTSPEGGLWGSASTWLMTFNELGQVSGDYAYVDEFDLQGYGCEPGWYEKNSLDEYDPVPAENVIIKFGEGVQILSDCGAKITFAGEVIKESKTFDILSEGEGGCTTTGNCSPVNLKLKDLAITSPEGGLWGSASTWLMTFNELGQVKGDYAYVDELDLQGYGCEPGWYEKNSLDEYDPIPAGNVDILAGEMVQILSDCGAKITIPSAL